MIELQDNARPKELTENDSYLELQQVYSKQAGITEREKRRLYGASFRGDQTEGPSSPLGAMTGSPLSGSFKMSSMTPTLNGKGPLDCWQKSEKGQPRKREDLQKRIAAYYQNLRGAGGYYEPTTVKNSQNMLWSVKPIPQVHRAITSKSHLTFVKSDQEAD